MPRLSSLAKVETQNCVETTSESDEETKRDKSLSPMSITSEIISDAIDKKNKVSLLEMEFKTKSIEFKRLKKNNKKARMKIINMMKENRTLVRRLRKLRELSQNCKPSRKVMIAERTSELKSLEEKRKVREKEIKQLWNAIQTQDNENVKLLLDAEEWKMREKEMNGELVILKEALTSSEKNHKEDEYLYISHSTDDWKLRLETDIECFQGGSNSSSSPSTVYLDGSQEKVILKSPHRNSFPERNGKKLLFRGGRKNVDKLHNKTKKIISSEIIMKAVDHKRKSITELRAESILMQRCNRLS